MKLNAINPELKDACGEVTLNYQVEPGSISKLLAKCLGHVPSPEKVHIMMEHPGASMGRSNGDPATMLVLNLTDTALAAETKSLLNTIYWVSDIEPESQLGALLVDYQGAFLNRDAEIVLQHGNERNSFECAAIKSFERSTILTVLAAVVAARLHGATARQIQTWLYSLAEGNLLT